MTPIPAGKASPGSGRSPVGGSGAGVETTPTSGGGSGAAVPAPGVPSEKLPPVVIASVGNHSGPVGTAVFPVVQGAQLWARFINERGGLNGQKVRLILYDDGGDPARNRSQVQEAVEKDGAAAFLANTAPLSGEGSVDYITSKRIPVLGSDTGDDFGFYDSPMFFPQAPSRGALLDATIFGIVNQVISQNVTKFAILDCAEPAIRICESMHRKWHEHAKALGYDVVYQARPSLAQPDFTAECLSAKNAGAQIVWMALDPNSVERVAASCARQDYRPIFTTGSAVITDRFKDNPNLEGFVGSMGIFPHFQAGTPSTDEYHAALATFGKGLSNGPPLIIGWVAGKMLEKAAAGTTGPITSQTILRGLWSLRQDTLGGMTMPLTFSENQPASPVACWFEIAVKNHTWVSPDRFNQHCKDTRAG